MPRGNLPAPCAVTAVPTIEQDLSQLCNTLSTSRSSMNSFRIIGLPIDYEVSKNKICYLDFVYLSL